MRRSRPLRSSGPAAHRSVLFTRTCPLAGLCRPIMWRMSVLLPQPLPPMMMKTSPRFIVKLRSFWITNEP